MPATATTSTTATVSYDPAQKTIAIEVIASLPTGASNLEFEVSPVAVPRDTWTLIWDLVVTTPGLSAEFSDPGIILPLESPQKPQQVTVVSPPASDGVGRWTAQLRNDGSDIAEFSYFIVVDWFLISSVDPAVDPIVKITQTCHDPTISVVKEPMG
jgi:hypothetical protein